MPDTYTKDQVVDVVLSMLVRQSFATWYNDGSFDKWIKGESLAPTEDKIRDQLKLMLGLEQ